MSIKLFQFQPQLRMRHFFDHFKICIYNQNSPAASTSFSSRSQFIFIFCSLNTNRQSCSVNYFINLSYPKLNEIKHSKDRHVHNTKRIIENSEQSVFANGLRYFFLWILMSQISFYSACICNFLTLKPNNFACKFWNHISIATVITIRIPPPWNPADWGAPGSSRRLPGHFVNQFGERFEFCKAGNDLHLTFTLSRANWLCHRETGALD